MTRNEHDACPAPAVGTWRNQYGSLLDITGHDTSGFVSGTYRSETGATGTYPAVGWIGEAHEGNCPFAISVFWRPLDSDVVDPGWHWVSVMTGVLYTDTHLQVQHGLVASGSFDAVELSEPGVYSETLVFDRVSAPPRAVEQGAPKAAASRAVGLRGEPHGWIESIDYVYDEAGRVSGTLTTRDGVALPVAGFIDPAPQGALQSVSLTMLKPGNDGRAKAIGVGGFVDRLAKRAALERFTARAVAHGNRYAGVSIAHDALAVAFIDSPSKGSHGSSHEASGP
ncbi:avidin/streptavidin family protein [Paraburkholderia sp. J63]|uniref:avidin/streptavidin family protein n=1 Tax=Paraburkholderia sp. J63 TaxID=2805434 RepID=UPI002ABD37E8|nr:avidin/streptavidin family protein [Paraburkholderia sp. J63]